MSNRKTFPRSGNFSVPQLHSVKSFRIRRFSGLYSVRMQGNTDQKNSEYGQFYAVLNTQEKYRDLTSEGLSRIKKEMMRLANLIFQS